MSQSKIRKFPPLGAPKAGGSHSDPSPSQPRREEIVDLVNKLVDLTGKKPEKAAQLIESWLHKKANKKAA